MSTKENSIQENTCLICLEENIIEDPYVCNNCNVSYHRECLTKWLTEKDTCPHCRHEISEILDNIVITVTQQDNYENNFMLEEVVDNNNEEISLTDTCGESLRCFIPAVTIVSVLTLLIVLSLSTSK